MKHSRSRWLVAGLAGTGALLASSLAMARVDVSVGIGVPGVAVAPPPVVYAPPPAYYAPPPVVYHGYPRYYGPRYHHYRRPPPPHYHHRDHGRHHR